MQESGAFDIRSDTLNKLVTDVAELERPLLYDRKECVYSTRVRVALENNSVDYDEIWVPADHEDRDVVEEITGQRAVPVLLDPASDTDYFTDTDTMLRYIEEEYS